MASMKNNGLETYIFLGISADHLQNFEFQKIELHTERAKFANFYRIRAKIEE